jgi:hypothetical protein
MIEPARKRKPGGGRKRIHPSDSKREWFMVTEAEKAKIIELIQNLRTSTN